MLPDSKKCVSLILSQKSTKNTNNIASKGKKNSKKDHILTKTSRRVFLVTLRYFLMTKATNTFLIWL